MVNTETSNLSAEKLTGSIPVSGTMIEEYGSCGTTKKVKIEISQGDIDRGIRCSIQNCPLYWALTKILNTITHEVHFSELRIADWIIPLSWQLQELNQRFDDGEIIIPGVYEIDIPEEFLS